MFIRVIVMLCLLLPALAGAEDKRLAIYSSLALAQFTIATSTDMPLPEDVQVLATKAEPGFITLMVKSARAGDVANAPDLDKVILARFCNKTDNSVMQFANRGGMLRMEYHSKKDEHFFDTVGALKTLCEF